MRNRFKKDKNNRINSGIFKGSITLHSKIHLSLEVNKERIMT